MQAESRRPAAQKERLAIPRPDNFLAEKAPPPRSWRPSGAQLLEIQRRAFGSPSAFVRDVIAASPELPAASGAHSMLAAGGAAMGTGTAKAAVATGGGFWSFLDGCLADDGRRGESQEPAPSPMPGEKSQNGVGAAAATAPLAGNRFRCFADSCLADDGGRDESRAPEQRPAPGGKKQNDDVAVPASVPVPAAATAPRVPGLGLEPWGSPGETTAAPAQEVDAVSPPDLSSGSGSPPDPAALARWAGAAGQLACDLPLPQDEPASQADSAEDPRDTTLAATTELAFGARLLPPESATPSSGIADALPSPTAAAASAAAGPGTGSQDQGMPAENERSQPNDTGISGTTRGAHTAPLDTGQGESQNIAIPGNARSALPTPEEGRTPPAPERQDAGPLASIATKGAAPSSERPAGESGGSAPAGQANVDGLWNAATPPPAGPEAQSAVPAQPASVARPAEAEPPEPAAQPVSRDVSLHLADGGSSVDIRMAERAGEIRVTVHTPDHELADSLRADLPDLVGKLRQSGFQAEAWRPAATQPDAGRRSGADGSPCQEHSPGARRDGRQRQPQPQQPKDRSRWAGEWKSSLDPAPESHT